MSVENITLDEWYGALEEIQRKPADIPGFTVADICGATGKSETSVRAKLRDLFRNGRLEMVGTRRVVRMDGRPNSIPVYRLVKK